MSQDERAPGPGRQTRRLRADAARNREAVVCAAREVFAEAGLDAPLEKIARRAGVGIGTLYRRFPCREQLVSAALIGKITAYADAAEQALAEPDPWAGFTGFVRRICAMQAGDRGLADLLLITLAPGEQLEAIRARANRNVIALIDKAKAAGRLRADVVGEDLLLLLIGNNAVAAAARCDAPQALPRFVALMLDAFEPHPDTSLPRPPTTAQMRHVMGRLAAAHGCGQPAAGRTPIQP